MPELSPYASALIVTFKQSGLSWIHKKSSDEDMVPKDNENYIYLTPDYENDPEYLEELIVERYVFIFEDILSMWTNDESKWPENLTYKLFKEWFEVKDSRNVNDTGGMVD
jgi:hypothetical protein